MTGTTDVGDAGVGQRVPGVLDLARAAAMSAIEQPAARSGRTTCWSGAVRMSADSAMKCTPQNTMNSASGPAGGVAGQLERVAGDVGELDDLVALVVVAEHEHPVAERLLGGPGPRHQVGVGGGGQVAGALDAALGARSVPRPRSSSGQVGCRHYRHLSTGPPAADSEEVRRCAGTASAASCPRSAEVARWSTARAGTPGPTSTAHSLAAVTCADLDGLVGRGRRQRLPEQVGGGAPVGRRQQVGPAARCDVGVARAGRPVDHDQPVGARSAARGPTPCAAPRTCRSTESIRSTSPADPSRTRSTTGSAARGDRARAAASWGAA